MNGGKRLVAGLLLTFFAAACGPADSDNSFEQTNQGSGTPCERPGRVTPPETGTVVIDAATAPCTIEFREVVILRGTENGVLPRSPVTLGPGGTYVTATYSPAEVAFWGADGEVVRLITKRAGNGPGELGTRIWGLLVDTLADRLYAFVEGWRIEMLSLDGTFQERISTREVSAGIGTSGALLADGYIVTGHTTRPALERPMLIAARGQQVERVGPARRSYAAPLLRAGRTGVWSSERLWYELNHHSMPDGRVDVRLRREVSWFPDGTPQDAENGGRIDGPGAFVVDFAIDESRGLVFTIVQAKDPDAPGPWKEMMIGGGPVPTGDEMKRQAAMYLDGLMEVFTLDGRLVASRRYDYRPGVPLPLTARLFYRVDESGLFPAIQILEAVLVQNPE